MTTLAGAALLAAACTATEEPAGVQTDDYLSELRSIAREVNLAIDAVGKAFEGDYGSTDLLFLALSDTRAANDLAIARDRARRLEPGPDRTADHERYLTLVDFALARAQEIDGAVAAGDAAAAAVGSFELEIAAGLAFTGLSNEACTAATFNARLCRAPVSGEPYATGLHPYLLRLTAAYLPGSADLPQSLTAGEQSELIIAIAPTLIGVLDAALEGVRDLEPPEEVAEDHVLLVSYLIETAAAHNRSLDAAEFGDLLSMEVGHRVAQREFCTTGPALSPEGRRYMAVFFLDELGICN
jgi:hypothetical protein